MLCLSTRAVDDPDSDAFYDSGLLFMPTLWILLSILSATLEWAVLGSTESLVSLFRDTPMKVVFATTLGPRFYWIFMSIICCFFALVISVLFSFLILTRGSHARTQHPKSRRTFQVLVAMLLIGVFHTCFLLPEVGWIALSAVPGVYILCCLFLTG